MAKFGAGRPTTAIARVRCAVRVTPQAKSRCAPTDSTAGIAGSMQTARRSGAQPRARTSSAADPEPGCTARAPLKWFSNTECPEVTPRLYRQREPPQRRGINRCCPSQREPPQRRRINRCCPRQREPPQRRPPQNATRPSVLGRVLVSGRFPFRRSRATRSRGESPSLFTSARLQVPQPEDLRIPSGP